MSDQTRHLYGLLARPYFPESTQPRGEVLVERFDSWTEVDGRQVRAVVAYEDQLTDTEIRHYSLHPISAEEYDADDAF